MWRALRTLPAAACLGRSMSSGRAQCWRLRARATAARCACWSLSRCAPAYWAGMAEPSTWRRASLACATASFARCYAPASTCWAPPRSASCSTCANAGWSPLSFRKTCSTGSLTTKPAASCSGPRVGSVTSSRTSDHHTLPTSLHLGQLSTHPHLPGGRVQNGLAGLGFVQAILAFDQPSPLHTLRPSPNPIIDTPLCLAPRWAWDGVTQMPHPALPSGWGQWANWEAQGSWHVGCWGRQSGGQLYPAGEAMLPWAQVPRMLGAEGSARAILSTEPGV